MSEQLNQNENNNRDYRVRITPEQQRQMGERVVHDRDLVKGGAEHNGYSELLLTKDQISKLRHERAVEQYKAKIEGTETGEAFNILSKQLDSAVLSINSAIDPDTPVPRGFRDLSFSEIASLIVRSGSLPPGQDSDMIVKQLNFGDPESKRALVGTLGEAKERLLKLKDDLAMNLEFLPGNKVAVPRNGPDGKPERLEPGWTVKGISANCRLKVVSPDGEYKKAYSLSDLKKVQAEYNASLKAETPAPEVS